MKLPVKHSLPLIALVLLSACGGGGMRVADNPAVPANGPEADYPMVLGPSFTVDGVTYTPADRMNYDAVGRAVIGPDGGSTVTAAHRTLPLPSYVEVTALDSGKTILVRVTRRGPMTGKQMLQLSPGAAAQLGVVGAGDVPVRVRRVNPVEPDRAALRSGMAALARMDTPKSLLNVLQRKLDQQEGVTRPAATDPVPDTPAAALPPKPEAKPKPKAEPKPKIAPRVSPAPDGAAAPAPAAPVKGGFVVQVGAFSSKANADAAAKRSGGKAVQGGSVWRVRMGPYASEAEAKAALAKARAAGYSDARIQRAD
ncbi:MAG: SPOR domain-containing protein [Sphingomonadales bacterium]|nr:SPOR domain-containing protein [Sphingomonadales bacterium]